MNEVLKLGDIVTVERLGGLYYHFAIYIGHGKVIQYAGKNGDWGKPRVHEASFKNFLRNDANYEVLNFNKNSRYAEILENGFESKRSEGNNSFHIYSPEETVLRARSRIGEQSYSLAFNNCEHFAIWCKTGIEDSVQVKAFVYAAGLAGIDILKKIKCFGDLVHKLDSDTREKKRLLKIVEESNKSFINIRFPTMGGKFFWDTITEVDGWKLQINEITHHARILDENNIRVAWGPCEALLDLMENITNEINIVKDVKNMDQDK